MPDAEKVVRSKVRLGKSPPLGILNSGLYHYRREDQDEKSRIHLRLDPDGHGTLIVNASRVLHLNPTAALMAYFALEDISEAGSGAL